MPGPNAPYTQLSADQVIQQSFDEANDRLRVDASVTASIGDVEIDANESDIAIKDRITGNLLKVNADGSIDANVNIDAAGGDNVAISDGTDTLEINPDGSINVAGVATEAQQITQNASLSSIDGKLSTSNASLASIDGKLTGVATEAKQDTQITALNSIDAGIPSALGQTTMAQSMPVVLASDQTSIPVTATLSDEPIKISGTEDGQANGTEFTFVNNLRLQILASKDRTETYTYADFGTKDERITRVEYTSVTFPGSTVRRDFNYTAVGSKYRKDSSVWSIV